MISTREWGKLAKPLAKVPTYHLQRGRAYATLGQWREVIRAAEEAQRLAPSSPQSYALLGQIQAFAREVGVPVPTIDVVLPLLDQYAVLIG